jgi:hypothetical protein
MKATKMTKDYAAAMGVAKLKDYYIDGQNTQMKAPQITPRWWIFWTMIFYNPKKFTSRSIQ